jgi:hypothetical protein
MNDPLVVGKIAGKIVGLFGRRKRPSAGDSLMIDAKRVLLEL